jgi:CRP-like cAMP-binding protein
VDHSNLFEIDLTSSTFVNNVKKNVISEEFYRGLSMEIVSIVLPNKATLLFRKLTENVLFTRGEFAILQEMGWEVRSVRRRQPIVIEGTRTRVVYFVMDGFLMRYRILRDGQRQVVNLIIPGDFAGVPSCFFLDSLYTIKALTNATVAALPVERLVGLVETYPRIAAQILWSFSCDSAIYAEHITVVGRRSALARVAHFLLELLTRLQRVGLADERSFKVPLRQDVISDALGLSLAYVNRLLRQLADEGLVFIRGEKIRINDVEELSSLADFERGYLRPLPMSEFAAAS